MNNYFAGDLRGELRLIQLLAASTGLDAVPAAANPEAETSAHVMVDKAIGTKTVQRVANGPGRMPKNWTGAVPWPARSATRSRTC